MEVDDEGHQGRVRVIIQLMTPEDATERLITVLIDKEWTKDELEAAMKRLLRLQPAQPWTLEVQGQSGNCDVRKHWDQVRQELQDAMKFMARKYSVELGMCGAVMLRNVRAGEDADADDANPILRTARGWPR